MLTLSNVRVRRGPQVLLDEASTQHLPRREGRRRRPQRLRQVDAAGPDPRRARRRCRGIQRPAEPGHRLGRAGPARHRHARWSSTSSTATSSCARWRRSSRRRRRRMTACARPRCTPSTMRLDGYTARSRAAQLAAGLGFARRGPRAPGARVLRRTAHARQPGARAHAPLGPAAAGRAHQPPGPGRASCGWRAGCAPTAARCCWSRTTASSSTAWSGASCTSRAAGSPPTPATTATSRCSTRRSASAPRALVAKQRREAAPHRELRGALPRPGQQGAPGAKPHQVRWRSSETIATVQPESDFDWDFLRARRSCRARC